MSHVHAILAIILPEQSVASEKEGLAVNKKGLTLKELLQQTSHHNSKVRRDALMGIKDLFLKHPTELRLHKYAVIEKLRERIGDDDKVVRETLYQLFKSVIFPRCKEDNQGLFISLIMAYIFNAMTHLTIDIRLMAFKFLDLVVQNYSPCFILYAEKILQSYEDILRKNQFYLQDKGKLKNVLSGLMRCLLLVPFNDKEADSCEKNDAGQVMLHAFEPDLLTGSSRFPLIIKKLNDVLPVLSRDIILHSFIYGSDKGKLEYELPYGGPDFPVGDGTISSLLMKKLLDVDRYFVLNILITRILLQFKEWIYPPPVVLEKFLEFIENVLLRKDCHSESSLKMACLSTIEDMIILVVLRLQLRLGQCALVNSAFEGEYEIMQYSLVEFYAHFKMMRLSGTLTMLPLLFCEFGFAFVEVNSFCCLSCDLEPFILFRIVEVLHSAYTAGHIRITDHICFFIILLSSFKVFPETIDPVIENDTKITNRGTFKSVTSVVCANLLQIGNSSLVFQIL
ncbi:Testis-expressed sequence 10 protein [Morella rubra]|uniref:Testis-expressed sequence 10 protein n=1 Tax=Morella rubra TaxID=262757 RepID=A0A6A1W3V4_9ROSI|nr:Testis-expressed sequence 10 protein [Morella rubra]